MSDAQGFAERLTAALDRKGRGYSNVQFARELTAALEGTGRGVANTTVTEWLKGRSEPPLYVIEAIGRVLGVAPSWLAFGVDAPRTTPSQTAPYVLTPEETAVPATRPPDTQAPARKPTRKRAG